MKQQPGRAGGRLTLRQLNRATLARQLLLRKERADVVQAVERVLALQAQLARPPYLALWSRIAGFQRQQLTRPLKERQIVRSTAMRGTLHLLTTVDFLQFRAAIQLGLDRGLQSILRERLKSLDVDHWVGVGRTFFGNHPANFDEFRKRIAALAPKVDVRAAALAVRYRLPLVQVPDDSTWGYPGQADFISAESWLGRRMDSGTADAGPLVLRYLSAFGPATVADAQTWSGLSGLQATFERLRPKLQTFADAKGRELFDLPEAPRPPEDAEAPVRFLPDFDSLILAHADRTRLIAEEHRAAVGLGNLRILPTFLVDGAVAGTWSIKRKGATATLQLSPFRPLNKKARELLDAEGSALLGFCEETARTRTLQFAKA